MARLYAEEMERRVRPPAEPSLETLLRDPRLRACSAGLDGAMAWPTSQYEGGVNLPRREGETLASNLRRAVLAVIGSVDTPAAPEASAPPGRPVERLMRMVAEDAPVNAAARALLGVYDAASEATSKLDLPNGSLFVERLKRALAAADVMAVGTPRAEADRFWGLSAGGGAKVSGRDRYREELAGLVALPDRVNGNLDSDFGAAIDLIRRLVEELKMTRAGADWAEAEQPSPAEREAERFLAKAEQARQGAR